MDRAVAQALTSLIPEWNDALPQELLDLAASLLAQSRNKASSLKAEEEIARTYACAHLACERLKQKIGLPKTQPRPPCPPKVYQKLYRHLDSALVAGTRRTPRALKTLDSTTPTKTPPVTPRKPVSTAPRTPHSARHKRKREPTISDEVPSWAMKTIRGLCKHFDAAAAPPHVLAGLSSILTLPRPFEQGVEDKELERFRGMSVEALIVAVYLFVRTRLSGVHTDPKAFPAQRVKALTVVSDLRGRSESSEALKSTDVEEWMIEIARGRWTELDWFANVKEGAGLGVDDGRVGSVDDSDGSDVDRNEALVHGKHNFDGLAPEKSYLQPGLGTMMQDRVDYLSDEKRADYQAWKKNILARIEHMEKAEQDSRSEVSAGPLSNDRLPGSD